MAAGITSNGSTHSRACITCSKTVRTNTPNLRAILTTNLLAEISVVTRSGLATHTRSGEHNPADKKGGVLAETLQSHILPDPSFRVPSGRG